MPITMFLQSEAPVTPGYRTRLPSKVVVTQLRTTTAVVQTKRSTSLVIDP